MRRPNRRCKVAAAGSAALSGSSHRPGAQCLEAPQHDARASLLQRQDNLGEAASFRPVTHSGLLRSRLSERDVASGV